MNLLSIIVPVYNVSDLVGRCIESIITQDYKNIEIIIINDGSEDNTLNIVNSYMYFDNRVRVYTKENAGPGAARDFGVTQANGDYITFVDADDYIEKNMYSLLMRKIVCKNADIIECGYNRVKTSGELISRVELVNLEKKGSECELHYVRKKNVTNFLWNKIFKKSLFSGIIFPHYFAGEDSCVLTQLYAKAKMIITDNNCLYNYVMTPQSLCRSDFSSKRLDSIKAGEFMYRFYQENNKSLSGYAIYYICSYAIQCYFQVGESNYKEKTEAKEYLMYIFKLYNGKKNDVEVKKNISFKRKLWMDLFNINPEICLIILKVRAYMKSL